MSTLTDTLFPYTTLFRSLAVLAAGTVTLGACTSYEDRETLESAGTGAAIGAAAGAGVGAVVGGISPLEGAAAGAVVGAIAGTIAADRDNDGRADGYYTQDGTYYPYETTPPPAYTAPPPTYRSGERSEERRVGQECVSTCRTRGELYH